jgi:hypothetical protein
LNEDSAIRRNGEVTVFNLKIDRYFTSQDDHFTGIEEDRVVGFKVEGSARRGKSAGVLFIVEIEGVEEGVREEATLVDFIAVKDDTGQARAEINVKDIERTDAFSDIDRDDRALETARIIGGSVRG